MRRLLRSARVLTVFALALAAVRAPGAQSRTRLARLHGRRLRRRLRALDPHGRAVRLRRGCATVLNLTGTFESREFRWAYVVRYGRDFGLTTEARNALLAESLADAEQHHRFFVTLGGSQPRDLDLSDERGAWRVLLIDDRGRQTRPIEIEHVRRPTPAERATSPASLRSGRCSAWCSRCCTRTAIRPCPRRRCSRCCVSPGSEGQVDLKWEFGRP